MYSRSIGREDVPQFHAGGPDQVGRELAEGSTY
jgi:hypothetical protein